MAKLWCLINYDVFYRLVDLATSDVVDIGVTGEDNDTQQYQMMAFQSLTEYMYWDFGDYNVTVNISNLVRYRWPVSKSNHCLLVSKAMDVHQGYEKTILLHHLSFMQYNIVMATTIVEIWN